MRLPYLPLYCGDFIGSTLDLDAHEQGLLLVLTVYAWTMQQPLPSDLDALARAIRASPKQLKAAWPKLRSRFEDLGDGQMYMPDVEARRSEQQAGHAIQVISGVTGAVRKGSMPRKQLNALRSQLARAAEAIDQAMQTDAQGG